MANRKLHVGNISYRVSSKDLRVFLSKYGPISSCSIVRDNRGLSKGFGFVTFKDRESAESALKRAGKGDLILYNRVLRLSHSRSDIKRPSDSDNTDVPQHTTSGISQCPDRPSKDPVGRACVSPLGEVTHLSDDVLLMVFCYLNLRDLVTVERICRRWNRLALTHWHSKTALEFKGVFSPFKRGYSPALTDQTLLQVLHKTNRRLLSLDLSASSRLLTEYAFDKLGILSPLLQELNLTHCRLSRNSATCLSSRLTCLKHLTLKSCTLSEKSLWWFLQNCHDLQYLNIEDNRQLSGKCFFVCKGQLQTVIMGDCVNVTDEGVVFLIQTSPNLEVIKLNNCDRITMETLTLLSKSCVKLRILEIASKVAYRPDPSMFQYLQNLESIVMDYRRGVCDELLTAVGECCSKLRKISLVSCYSITDRGVCALSQCINLTDINISYCTKVSDYGVIRLSINASLIKMVARGCNGITNEGIIGLLENSSNISEFDVCGCFAVTNSLLSELEWRFSHENGRQTRIKLFLGGTQITIDCVKHFEIVTDVFSISLHDYSQASMHEDYELSISLSNDMEDLSSSSDCSDGCYLEENDHDSICTDEFSCPEDNV